MEVGFLVEITDDWILLQFLIDTLYPTLQISHQELLDPQFFCEAWSAEGLLPGSHGWGRYLQDCFITPFGMFGFLRLPFDLRNTGNTFQRMMNSILSDLPYCFPFVDNILEFSTSLEQHVDHLHQVLLLCQQHRLMIGLSKCEFAVPKIEFLGHVLSASGCSPLVKHTAAISKALSDKPALQRFLGMINFYRKISPGGG